MGNCGFNEKAMKFFSSESECVNLNLFTMNYPIGKGGFGKVWKVTKKSNQENFALKEISKVLLYEKNSVACVINERTLLAFLRHPFIINMHYAFQDKENLYIVMDYLSGGDLRYHICKHRKFTEEQARFFIACLLLALEFLHHNNVIHRDVKPENLVFDKEGYLHLTDLGISKFYLKNKVLIDSSGTPGYMSPEVILNQPHTFTSDFFAIGVILHELVFQKRPYIGKSRKEIKDLIISKEISIKPCDLPDNWSPETADLITKLLKRRMKNRIGKNGIFEIKTHPWLKSVDWSKLYNRELVSPFIPKPCDNFDKNYCNKEDPIDKANYEVCLHKVSLEYSFKSFTYNYYAKNNEVYFNSENVKYKFTNPHAEEQNKSTKFNSTKKHTLVNNTTINNYLKNESVITNHVNQSIFPMVKRSFS